MRKSILHIVLVCLAAFLLSSCNTIRRFVPEGSHLLNKNKVVIENGPVAFKKSDVSSYIQQQPIKTSYPFRIPLWFHYITQNKQGSFGKWINQHLGKQPEYYDPNATVNSARQIEQYLNNRGYFNSKVTTEAKRVSRMRRHLIRTTYTIQAAEPYRIRKIYYQIEDTVLAPHLTRLESRFPAQVGQIYNSYTLDEQRTYITEYMRNAGYYFFTKDLITYEVDSSFNDHSLEITMKIANPVDRESGKSHPHRRYFINRINIYPNYSPLLGNLPPVDSTSLSLTTGYRNIPNTLHFYYHEKPRVRPNTFSQMIQVIQGQPYRLRQVSQTYSALSNLKIIGNSSIEFDTVSTGTDSLHLLNCNIYMRQTDQHAFKVQTEGTNTGGDLGINGSVTYTNKNIFHGAEVLQVSVKGGLEAQKIAELDELDEEGHLFNTGELILNTSLFIPKFLSPIPLKTFAWDYQPRTTFSLGSSTQVRYAYSRYITMGSYGYDWKANPRLQFIFTPIYLNSVKVNPSPEFQALLDQESNQRLKDQYTNHLILGGKYTFIYNTQNSLTHPRRYVYLRGTIESSGGLLSLFNNTKLVTENDDHHELLGIRYAQFLRADVDFRQYWRLGDASMLVFRQFVGVGVPYGNSYDMPFERSFYAGGSTGMRGWTYRKLGPGAYTYKEGTNIERIGDIQLECNAEFRFPVYGSVNGAVFADVGNIWNYHDNELLPGGAFHFDTFYRQLAFDAGIGARFDFKVAIIRLDLAMPLRNPYPDAEGHYWNLDDFRLFDLHPVLNIGYPF